MMTAQLIKIKSKIFSAVRQRPLVLAYLFVTSKQNKLIPSFLATCTAIIRVLKVPSPPIYGQPPVYKYEVPTKNSVPPVFVQLYVYSIQSLERSNLLIPAYINTTANTILKYVNGCQLILDFNLYNSRYCIRFVKLP